MPRLNTLIEVGFCLGYGDGDYRVSMEVQNLSRERWQELQLAVLGALHCADLHWKSAQAEKPENQGHTDKTDPLGR